MLRESLFRMWQLLFLPRLLGGVAIEAAQGSFGNKGSRSDVTLLGSMAEYWHGMPHSLILADVIQKVIEDHPYDVEVAKRVALGRKAVRNIFAEMGRLGQRKQTPA
ncbi:hypothetical protein HPB52_004666 [Rhipicephalus sanguineus]|uniref:Uncharacterized protein n=1 Tax=Rhipicephalus sanguineus TaxID=34632 RepID=A0A9D4T5K1_RHISA|nr:hypothetical protein HPB52_004666 [Rhipicephalus sanguineus]